MTPTASRKTKDEPAAGSGSAVPPVPESVDGGATAPETVAPPNRIPTREEMRERIRIALGLPDKNGVSQPAKIGVEEVLADIYAALYNIEVTVAGMMSMASKLPGFGRMSRKMERQLLEEGHDDSEG